MNFAVCLTPLTFAELFTSWSRADWSLVIYVNIITARPTNNCVVTSIQTFYEQIDIVRFVFIWLFEEQKRGINSLSNVSNERNQFQKGNFYFRGKKIQMDFV